MAGGSWINFPIFPQKPLEIKLGTYTNGLNPDALTAILWNDGTNNRLDTVRIPPPYDGSNITSHSLENTATLFALGDICTTSKSVIIPYIKNFNLEVAKFSNNSWSTITLPETTLKNYDNADCIQTSNGLYVAGHNLTDSETLLFNSNDNGASFTFYVKYVDVAGPFDGAARETLSSLPQAPNIISLNQTKTGMMRVTQVNTDPTPPVINHTNIRQFSAPISFTFVKEAAGHLVGKIFHATYNADGNARTVDVPINNPSTFTERNLGTVNNNGSQYNFQGTTLVHVENQDGSMIDDNNVLWGDYFVYDINNTLSPPSIDTSYPLAGVGGPVDGCRLDSKENIVNLIIAGSRKASALGTDIYIKTLANPTIFSDGFESGDTFAWSQCN